MIANATVKKIVNIRPKKYWLSTSFLGWDSAGYDLYDVIHHIVSKLKYADIVYIHDAYLQRSNLDDISQQSNIILVNPIIHFASRINLDLEAINKKYNELRCAVLAADITIQGKAII